MDLNPMLIFQFLSDSLDSVGGRAKVSIAGNGTAFTLFTISNTVFVLHGLFDPSVR